MAQAKTGGGSGVGSGYYRPPAGPTLWTYDLPGFRAENVRQAPDELFAAWGGLEGYLAAQQNRASADASAKGATDSGTAGAADGGILTQPMAALAPGSVIPVVFARRRTGGTGGVLVQPRATEVAISNTATTYSVAWHCVLSDGQLPGVQVRDVRNGLTRDGAFSQRYGGRAGAWFPGNRTVAQAGQEIPAFPLQCGGGGNYEGLTTIEFRNTYPVGSQRWSQAWSVFVREGIIIQRGRLLDSVVGPSDNLCDLIIWALVRSGRMTEADIDLPTMAATARFLDTYGLLCNAEFQTATNLPELLTSTLPFFLLGETTIGGRYAVVPLVPTNADGTIRTDIEPEWIFSEQSIAPGSYSEAFPPAGSRGPLELTATYRQQTSDTEPPLVCTMAMGRASDDGAAVETLDMAGFCTSRQHAAMAMGYRLATRQYGGRTASVTLLAGDQSGFLAQGQICQVTLNVATELEPAAIISGYWLINQVDRSIDGNETLQLSEVPVDAAGQSIIAQQVLAARDLAGDVVFPYPVIGGSDVPGRSTDQSVPATTLNPEIVPYSQGGGATGPVSEFVRGGGKAELPPPNDPKEPDPPGPGDGGPVTLAGGDPPEPDQPSRRRGNPPVDVREPFKDSCKYGYASNIGRALMIKVEGSGPGTGISDIEVARYPSFDLPGEVLGHPTVRIVEEFPQNTIYAPQPLLYQKVNVDITLRRTNGTTYSVTLVYVNFKGGPRYDGSTRGEMYILGLIAIACRNPDGSGPALPEP